MFRYYILRNIKIYLYYNFNPERKRTLGRSRRRWENNNKMVLQEMGCVSMDWIELALDRDRWRALVNAVMKFGFHKLRGIS